MATNPHLSQLQHSNHQTKLAFSAPFGREMFLTFSLIVLNTASLICVYWLFLWNKTICCLMFKYHKPLTATWLNQPYKIKAEDLQLLAGKDLKKKQISEQWGSTGCLDRKPIWGKVLARWHENIGVLGKNHSNFLVNNNSMLSTFQVVKFYGKKCWASWDQTSNILSHSWLVWL